jgi:hypothetical protein
MNINDFKKQADSQCDEQNKLANTNSERNEKIEKYLDDVKTDFIKYFVEKGFNNPSVEPLYSDFFRKSFVATATYKNYKVSLTYQNTTEPLMGCIVKFVLEINADKEQKCDIFIQSNKDDLWYFTYDNNSNFNRLYDLLTDFFK